MLCALFSLIGSIALQVASIEWDTKMELPVTAAIWTPNADGVVFGSQGKVEWRTWPDLNATEEIPSDLRYIHALAFSLDGQFLAIAGGSPAEFGQLEIWDWSKRRPLTKVTVHDDVICDVAFHAKGDLLVTASSDATCRVLAWSLNPNPSLREVGKFEAHSRGVLSLVFIESDLIATAGLDGIIRIWDCRKQTELRSFDQHLSSVGQLILLVTREAREEQGAPFRDSLLASASLDRTVRFWDTRTGRMIRFARMPSVPTAIGWSAREQRVIVGGRDGYVRWIDLATGKETRSMATKSSRITNLLVHPQSGDILIVGDGVDAYTLDP